MQLNVLPQQKQKYEQHLKNWSGCTRCQIGKWAHKHVFARGTLPCELLFIGEAPGKMEDILGYPFVGKAGKILSGWINELEESFPEIPWAITNVVCCRPTDKPGDKNRKPNGEEIVNCRQRLYELILRIARPDYIVLLGRVAQDNSPEWEGLDRFKLYHPAYVGYNGGTGSLVDLECRKKLIDFVSKQRSRCAHRKV